MRPPRPVLLLVVALGSPPAPASANPPGPPPTPPGSTAPGEAPLVRFDTGAPVVTVRLDGDISARFLLDTGASRTVVACDLADRLGLAPAGHAAVATAHTTAVMTMRRLTSLTLADRRQGPLAVLVVPRRDLAIRGRVDGIVGLDVLSGHAFTVDREARVFRWGDGGAAAAAGTALGLTIEAGRAIVTLPYAAATGGRLRLLADSGARELVLFTRPGLAVAGTPGRLMRVRTLTTERLARQVTLDDWPLDAPGAPSGQALLVEPPPALAGAVDGLLPLHVFSRVTVDGPGGRLVVEP